MVLKDKKYILLFLSPALILITVFLLYPLVMTFYNSFTYWYQWSTKDRHFIGLANYMRMFQDPVVWIALKNTLMLIVLCVIFEVGLAFLLALLVDSIRKGYKIFRTVYFFPVVIAGAAIGLMFSLAYNYDYGLLNNILVAFGGEKKVWLTEKSAAILTQIPVIWQMIGFYFVIFLTSMSKIPRDIYESAELDGATGVRKTFCITIPLVWDVVIVCIALVITGATKVFDVVYTITQGGPLDASQLLSTYMYQSAFVGNNQGYGSTIAAAMVILGVGLTAITSLFNRKEQLTY